MLFLDLGSWDLSLQISLGLGISQSYTATDCYYFLLWENKKKKRNEKGTTLGTRILKPKQKLAWAVIRDSAYFSKLFFLRYWGVKIS